MSPRGYFFLIAKFAAGYVPADAKRKFTASHSRPQTLSEAIAAASGKLWTEGLGDIGIMGDIGHMLLTILKLETRERLIDRP